MERNQQLFLWNGIPYQVDDVSSMLLAHYNGTQWEEVPTTVQGPGGSGSASNTGGRVTSSCCPIII